MELSPLTCLLLYNCLVVSRLNLQNVTMIILRYLLRKVYVYFSFSVTLFQRINGNMKQVHELRLFYVAKIRNEFEIHKKQAV